MNLSAKLPLLSEIALLIGFAWLISGWLIPDQAMKTPGLPSLTSESPDTLPPLSRLISIPLFGKAAPAPKPAKAVKPRPKPVVVAPLTIKLLGTVVANAESAAIIAKNARAEQRVFFIGDTIEPGVILKSVEASAIVVSHNGKSERISMEKNAIAGLTPTSMPPGSMPVIAPPQRMRPGRPGIPNSRQLKFNRSKLNTQLQDFPKLLSQARVIPNMINGRANGFKITEIAPGSLYQQAGLQNGDIIMSVNGKPITGAKQAMAMYQQLQRANSIDLIFRRAGTPQRIHYDIR